MTRRLLLLVIVLLISPCRDLRAQQTSQIPGWSVGVYSLVSGLWEEAGESVRNQRYDHRYSWGKAMVISNYGVVIELGTQEPFVQWVGEPFAVTAISVGDDGLIEIGLKDASTAGDRAFTAMQIAVETSGTARMDFIRADGSRFGEIAYERLYGPGMK